MSIVVAICTWNRASLLNQTLKAMQAQPWAATGATLLVVDNGSTDETEAVLKSFRDQLPIRWVREQTPGHSAARNRALDEAGSASYLLFTDDDVLVGHEWLSGFAEAVERFPDGAVYGGPVDPWFAFTPDPQLVEAFPALGVGFCGVDHPGADGPIDSGTVFGANLGFRLSALEGMRFDLRLGHKHGRYMAHEEVSIIDTLRKRGGQVIWVPRMRLRHYVDATRLTQQYLVRHYEDYARGLVRMSGVPEGRTFAGVPTWIVRRLLERRLAYIAYSAMGKRREALKALRESSLAWGTVKESFALAREKSQAKMRPGGEEPDP